MYSLLSGFYRYMFKKEEYFVLILGLDNAGKTVSLALLEIMQIGIFVRLNDIYYFCLPSHSTRFHSVE